MVKLLDARGREIPEGAGALVRRHAAVMSNASAFAGADPDSASLKSWNPSLQSADAESRWSRDRLTARVRDLYRNSPIARSGVNNSVARGIGAGWSLRAKPDWRKLNITFEQSVQLALQMEMWWRTWANDVHKRCDAQRKQKAGGLFRTLWKQRKVDGENLAILRWRDDNGPFNTCLQIIDTDRLCNRDRVQDTPDRRQGVHFDPDYGEPTGYDILNGHPNDWGLLRGTPEWETVPRTTSWGRPVGLHGFSVDRPDQTRGVTPFAPVLKLFKMTDRYWEAEVQQAILGSIIGTFIKSGFDPAAVAERLASPADLADEGKNWQELRVDFYEDNPVKMGDVRVPVMMPGDELVLTNAARDTGPAPEFVKIAFQQTAAALGEAYPELAQNWEGVSYSSARTAYNSVWRHVVVDGAEFEDDCADPIYYAVMEEAFDRGYIEPPAGAPDFWDDPTAYLDCSWTGPGREHVDPLKGVQADEAEIDARLATFESQSAKRGRDWREDAEQRAREEAYFAELNLPPRHPEKALAIEAPTDEEARLGNGR